MRNDSREKDTTPDLVAEMRAIVEETRRAIEASQAILDRCADRAVQEPDRAADADTSDALGEISDGLIHAYRFAKRDGDPLTVTLIERALFRVGQRLARGLSPAEAGLRYH